MHPRCAGLADGDQRDHRISEPQRVALGLNGIAGTGDDEIFQADDAVAVDVHRIQIHR